MKPISKLHFLFQIAKITLTFLRSIKIDFSMVVRNLMKTMVIFFFEKNG